VKFDIGNGAEYLDVSLHFSNRIQDSNASTAIENSNLGGEVSFTIHDRARNGRDVIDGVDAKVVELAWVDQSLSTEGICQLACIYTALTPIHANCSLDVGCIAQSIL